MGPSDQPGREMLLRRMARESAEVKEEPSLTAQAAHPLKWIGLLSALLAILACYGTSLVVLGVSLLGVTLAVDEGAWAAAVSLFALLAFLGVAPGYLRHRKAAPGVLALSGAALTIWAMLGQYNWIVELGGLGALILAAGWDWRLKRLQSKRETEDA